MPVLDKRSTGSCGWNVSTVGLWLGSLVTGPACLWRSSLLGRPVSDGALSLLAAAENVVYELNRPLLHIHTGRSFAFQSGCLMMDLTESLFSKECRSSMNAVVLNLFIRQLWRAMGREDHMARDGCVSVTYNREISDHRIRKFHTTSHLFCT